MRAESYMKWYSFLQILFFSIVILYTTVYHVDYNHLFVAVIFSKRIFQLYSYHLMTVVGLRN